MKRIKTAEVFSGEITNKIHELGMAGKLQIVVEPINSEEPHQHGMDEITVLEDFVALLNPSVASAFVGGITELSVFKCFHCKGCCPGGWQNFGACADGRAPESIGCSECQPKFAAQEDDYHQERD